MREMINESGAGGVGRVSGRRAAGGKEHFLTR